MRIPNKLRRPAHKQQPVTEPADDYGFFGPDSVAWKVWRYPTSVILGFSRAVTVEELDPLLVASVQHSGQIKRRPFLRYDRTLQYFATVMFGSAEAVLDASELLMKIHARSVGTDPVTGRDYDANNPESQLWIHLTAWHSILYTYEVFGPGKLPPQQEAEYWEACALAAEFQTIDPDDVPRTREGVRAYFDNYRPQLIGSELARDMFQYLANMELHALPPSVPGPVRQLVNLVTSRAVIATLPRWMREMGGTPQSRVTDAVVVIFTKGVIHLVAASVPLQKRILALVSPRTVAVTDPMFDEVPPRSPRVYTPAEARAAFGNRPTPQEIYAELLAQRERGAGPTPYAASHDDALLEFDQTVAS